MGGKSMKFGNPVRQFHAKLKGGSLQMQSTAARVRFPVWEPCCVFVYCKKNTEPSARVDRLIRTFIENSRV